MPISRQQRIALASGGGLLAVLLIVVVAFAVSGNGKPTPKSDPVELARYIATPDFGKMSHQEQLSYMNLMSGSTTQLNAAFRAKKISEDEYTSGLLAGYIARKYKQVDGYLRLNTVKDRTAYLDKIIDKDIAEEKEPPKENTKDDEPLIKLDFSDMAKEYIKAWPEDRQDDYDGFRKALKDRRKARGVAP